MPRFYFLFLLIFGFGFGLLLGVILGNRLDKKIIFNYDKQVVLPSPSSFELDENSNLEDKKITLIAVGDILLARKVNYEMVIKNNFNWPFEKVAGFLKSADFTFANLESPIVKGCKPTQTGMVFCGDERVANSLVFAGIDACNLANNHSLDYGKEGLFQTKEILSSVGISSFGDEDVLRKEIKGVNFSFLGFNEVGLGEEAFKKLLDQLSLKIKLEKEGSDFVIVSFHWGDEYTEEISPRQREFSRLAIDSGADLVIGHHPHWIQGKEEYKSKKIFYSLGNFVFDQMWSEKTKEGMAIRFTLEGANLRDVEEFKVKIENFGQPYFLD